MKDEAPFILPAIGFAVSAILAARVVIIYNLRLSRAAKRLKQTYAAVGRECRLTKYSMFRFAILLPLLTSLLSTTAMCADSTKLVFRNLPPDALVHMQKQREFVAQLITQHFPTERITRSKADFALLQKILNAKLIRRDETWKLQSLGIVFGDALTATIGGLAWCEVTDEYGTDPTLRFRETTLQLNALTMISKRVEDGKEVDVTRMAEQLADFVRTKAHEYR